MKGIGIATVLLFAAFGCWLSDSGSLCISPRFHEPKVGPSWTIPASTELIFLCCRVLKRISDSNSRQRRQQRMSLLSVTSRNRT